MGGDGHTHHWAYIKMKSITLDIVTSLAQFAFALVVVFSLMAIAMIAVVGYNDDAFSIAFLLTAVGGCQNVIPTITYNVLKSRGGKSNLMLLIVLLLPFLFAVEAYGMVLYFNTGSDAGVAREIGVFLMIVGLISPLVALAVNAMTGKKWFYWCGAAVSLIAVAVCVPIARL